jgi:hypothetical protein
MNLAGRQTWKPYIGADRWSRSIPTAFAINDVSQCEGQYLADVDSGLGLESTGRWD